MVIASYLYTPPATKSMDTISKVAKQSLFYSGELSAT